MPPVLLRSRGGRRRSLEDAGEPITMTKRRRAEDGFLSCPMLRSRGCDPSRADWRPRTIEQVVDAYIRDWRAKAAGDLSFYRNQPSRTQAIRLAALAQTVNGKHPHQWRIKNSVLCRAAVPILSSTVRRSRTFHELHVRVRAAVARVRGIGELAIYDTALRIGAYLGLRPRRVYLHRGTRRGAAALGLGRGRKMIEVGELPRPFQRLRPYEIEDCLCIYERELRRCAAR